MSYVDTDLKRELQRACTKAKVSMAPEEIAAALNDMASEISGSPDAPSPPDPEE